MSLVGSLGDLGLADILQIVNLARKSGVLCLHCEHGEGRIVFREGLVHAAAVKGESDGFESLLQRRGLAGGGPHDAAGQGRVEEARRDLVERAVARMFEWRTGRFSFDVSDDLAPEDASSLLATGLSPQYLTMEATRRGDERRADRSDDPDEPGAGWRDDPLVFSGELEDADDPRAVLVEAILGRVDPEEIASPHGREEPAPQRAEPVRAACAQVVVVDPDLAALEWLKATLADLFERVHIFQGAEGGIARIRQYLGRGELPALLLAERAPMDPLSGIESASDLLRRLRIQAPRMPLLLLTEAGEPTPRAARFADGVLIRPAAGSLPDRGSRRIAAMAEALRERVAPFARKARAEEPPADPAPPGGPADPPREGQAEEPGA